MLVSRVLEERSHRHLSNQHARRNTRVKVTKRRSSWGESESEHNQRMRKLRFDINGGLGPAAHELAMVATAATGALIVGGWDPLVDGALPVPEALVVFMLISLVCVVLIEGWVARRWRGLLTKLWSLGASVFIGGSIGLFNVEGTPSGVAAFVLPVGAVVICATAIPMNQIMGRVEDKSSGVPSASNDEAIPDAQAPHSQSSQHSVQMPENQHPAGH